MANLKDIAATLAILGSGALVMSGCGKDKPATEVPAGGEAAPAGDAAGGETPAEGSCGAGGEEKPAEGSCGAGGAEGEKACGEAGGEKSCGG